MFSYNLELICLKEVLYLIMLEVSEKSPSRNLFQHVAEMLLQLVVQNLESADSYPIG
jgi:hypothetical protein